ncbi:MAG: DUF3168 domain-containing protein [Pseudomonadota bacterium]|nr:DUF3168 domain-containing protein [Pseudomonadota bacterium]
MSAPEIRVQQTIAHILEASEEARSLFGSPLRLAATPGQRLAFPYLGWGRVQCRDRAAAGVDLLELRQDLLVWDREDQVHQLTGRLRHILRRGTPPDLSPWVMVSLLPVFTDSFQTRRPQIRRGLIRFRALIASQEDIPT